MTRDREGEYLDASFAAFSGGASDPPSMSDPSQPRPPQPEPLDLMPCWFRFDGGARCLARPEHPIHRGIRTSIEPPHDYESGPDRRKGDRRKARAALGGATTPDLDAAWRVHNHGPEEGRGVGCREYHLNGRLVGGCLIVAATDTALAARLTPEATEPEETT